MLKTNGNVSLSGGSIPLVSPDLLAEIISTASDISLHIDRGGIIKSVLVNPVHRSFGQLSHWEGQHVRTILTDESVQKFNHRIAQLEAAEDGTSLALEVTHSDGTSGDFPIRYALHRLPNDQSVLMLGRDLRAIADIQQKLISVQLALEKDYEAQREIDTRYRVLMEMTRDAIMLVSMSTGRIGDLNTAAANLLGGPRQELLGAAVAQEFVGRRRGELLETMASLASADSATPIEMQARRSQKRVMMVPLVFRAAGERLLLCRLDVPEAAVAQDDLADGLTRLYHDGVDGIVFTDRDGVVRGANEAFLNLTDSPSLAAVRGRSLGDFLVRGSVDLKVLLENARRTGRMRLYATRLLTVFSAQVAVEVSATWFGDRPSPVMALIVRDASRAEALRRPGVAVGGDDGVSSVVELVGSSKLKDIVAETADVVERMCIEAAVELTRNNRVAAAEMLGLSRQSLYVKLRKYGLVNKGDV